MIKYLKNVALNLDGIVRVFDSSTINRPTNDLSRIKTMFENANLIMSAWDGDQLVGLCRALTDFSYCCYLSDLAVVFNISIRVLVKNGYRIQRKI